MGTIAQTFFHANVEQDFTAAGEVDIKKLVEAAPGGVSTTRTLHANAAGTTQITLDPYSDRNTVGDIRANAGWAINRLGADGMESTASGKRIIPAGAWTFTLNVALPVAGTTTGTLTVSFIAQVFRVSSSGARTALFTATSNTGQSTGLAALASTTLTATSAAQPQYTLEADETIHVGFLSNLVQVAGLVGATVAGTATWTVGAAAQFVRVPAPGVRTAYTQSNDLIGKGVILNPDLIIVLIERGVIGKGVPTHTKLTTASRTYSFIGIGTLSYTKVTQAQRTFSLIGKGTVTRTVNITPNARSLVGIGTPTYTRAVTASKTFSLTGVGTASRLGMIAVFATRDLVGKGVITYVKATNAARAFSVIGKGEVLKSGANASSITIPIDEVPEAGGGGGTTIIRKQFILLD